MKDYIILIEEYICAELGLDDLSERQYQLLFDNCSEYMGLGYTTEYAAEQLIGRVQQLSDY